MHVPENRQIPISTITRVRRIVVMMKKRSIRSSLGVDVHSVMADEIDALCRLYLSVYYVFARMLRRCFRSRRNIPATNNAGEIIDDGETVRNKICIDC
jgi:hypothetical protein